MIPGIPAGVIWRYDREHHKPLHFHGQLEFVLVLRGRAVERIGTQLYSIHAGQLVWHLPSIPHEMLFASSDLDLRVVLVEPDLAAALCQKFSAKNPLDASLPRHKGKDSSFSGWVRDLGWLATGHPVIELARADMDRLLEDCDRSFEHISPSGYESECLTRLIRNAWAASIVNSDGGSGSSLSELASCLLLEDPGLDRSAICRVLDVSEGYLSRCFQQQLHTTFATQRARIRIARFAAHVEREQQNFLQAALSAGFGSYSQLHRTFCGVVGMRPSDYFQGGGRMTRTQLSRHDVEAS